jgi:anthranilate synthase component 1
MVRFFERIPDQKRPGLDLPDIFFMVADTMLIFDSLKQKIKIVSNVLLDGKDPQKAYLEAAEKIESVIKRLKKSVVRQVAKSKEQRVKSKESKNSGLIVKSAPSGYSSSFITKEAFEHAVLQGKEYIMSGDVVQVVLSQSFQRESSVDPFNIYRALRVINPSPYMYYIDTGDAKIVGSSPEILVRLEEKDNPETNCRNPKERGYRKGRQVFRGRTQKRPQGDS